MNAAVILAGVESAADYAAKERYNLIAYAGYAIVAYGVVEYFQQDESLVKLDAFRSALGAVMALGFGYLAGEQPSQNDIIGVGLIAAGILFLK